MHMIAKIMAGVNNVSPSIDKSTVRSTELTLPSNKVVPQQPHLAFWPAISLGC